jgi:type II secretory pathway pseudopilin PulG
MKTHFRSGGFTIVELLATLVTISVLSALAEVAVTRAKGKARAIVLGMSDSALRKWNRDNEAHRERLRP